MRVNRSFKVVAALALLTSVCLAACSSDTPRIALAAGDAGPFDGSSSPNDGSANDASDEGSDDAADATDEDAAPAIVISPRAAHVTTGHAQRFTASMPASWSVVEPAGGTIDSTGLYTAPTTVGTYHILASDDADAGLRTTAEIAVVAPGLDLVAGKPGGLGTADGIGHDARFNSLAGEWLDPAGDLYLADAYNRTIRRLHLATGEVSTLAGSALLQREFRVADCAEGIGAAASFGQPAGLIGDGAGNLYVADLGCFTVSKIVIATGQVTRLAGAPKVSASVDGTGIAGHFLGPAGLAWAAPGILFVGDETSIRTVNVSTGEITTVQGTKDQFVSGYSTSILFDGDHALFVTNEHAIEKVDLNAHSIALVAGDPKSEGMIDAVGGSARFSHPNGLALDGSGGLLVADFSNHLLRRIDLQSASVTTFAGHEHAPDDGTLNDGVGTVAGFALPSGVVVDGAGGIYVTEIGRVRRVDLGSRTVSTIAGDFGHIPYPSDPPGAVRFSRLEGIATDDVTAVLVTDASAIRAVALADGESVLAKSNALMAPVAIAVESPGVYYIADAGGTTVTKLLRATGDLTLIAGAPQQIDFVDDVGPAARFAQINGLYLDHAGSLFVADTLNCVIRKIDLASGRVTTFSGVGGNFGYMDGDAKTARFGSPTGITGDAQRLYVTDSTRVRTVDLATGTASTLAGGFTGYKDDVGTAAQFASLAGIALDAAKTSLFVADSLNSAIRKIDIATGTVTTVVGVPGQAGVTLGRLSTARLNGPTGVLPLPDGDLVIVDQEESSVLRLRY